MRQCKSILLRNIFLSFLLISCGGLSIGQTLTFNASGESNTIEQIVATNLTTNASASFIGNQVFLNNTATGIDMVTNNSSVFAYPNPFNGQTMVQFSNNQASKTQFLLVNELGQVIMQQSAILNTGLCNIVVQTPKAGLYTLLISGSGELNQIKLLSNQASTSHAAISFYCNTETPSVILYKSANAGNVLNYGQGDRILFEVKSGIYTTILTDVPSIDNTYGVVFYACTDGDGNNYKTVTIGNQVWMAENLRTTKYNDGTPIPNETDDFNWLNLTTPAYCNYNNSTNGIFISIYGCLYNFFAVTTGKLAPKGWHVASEDEWVILTDYLGNSGIAGCKLKDVGTEHWFSPNINATNEVGFTALPGGARYSDGAFSSLGGIGYWWTSTENLSKTAWRKSIIYADVDVSTYGSWRWAGYSVRCIKD